MSEDHRTDAMYWIGYSAPPTSDILERNLGPQQLAVGRPRAREARRGGLTAPQRPLCSPIRAFHAAPISTIGTTMPYTWSAACPRMAVWRTPPFSPTAAIFRQGAPRPGKLQSPGWGDVKIDGPFSGLLAVQSPIAARLPARAGARAACSTWSQNAKAFPTGEAHAST